MFPVEKIRKNKIWDAWTHYMLSVILIWCKTKALKKKHFKGIVKWFKSVQTYEWPYS